MLLDEKIVRKRITRFQEDELNMYSRFKYDIKMTCLMTAQN